jgi:ABC-type branched-subunit amino acid transport system substrate-binding protein
MEIAISPRKLSDTQTLNHACVKIIKSAYPRSQEFELYAFTGMDLINTQVQAILGPQTWEEVSLIADICTKNQIPIFSFADTTPEWTTEKWPFLIGASHDNFAQMKAIAAVVQSWNWHQVTVIHEDVGSWTNGVMPYLHDSLREIGAEVSQFVGLSSFASSDSLSRELKNLKREQCRVFVVHLSLPLAVRLFEMAKKLKMMEKDYVWITTHHITSLVHSIDASIISSMQGIVGVKSYFSETGTRFQDFSSRFRKRFRRENPEEENNEPGIYAVQAYDAIWTIARALKGSNRRNQELLEKVLQTDFQGLSGKVQFNNHKMAPTQMFQIINVVGKSYRELGFWSSGLGFSETIGKHASYSPLMNDLEQVLWPGGPRYTPRGWTELTREKPLLVGVPAKSGYKEYVKVEYDRSRNATSFDGLAIEIFNATVRRLPFYLPYEFVAFNDISYDNLVGQIGKVRICSFIKHFAPLTS